MQETPQQYIQRMLGLVEGKEPVQVQKTTAEKLTKLLQGLDQQKFTRRPGTDK